MFEFITELIGGTTLEAIGWIGGFFFAICAVPQAWQSYRQGHSVGLSWMFLWFWLLGEVLTTIYVLPKEHWPLIFNYVFNIILLLIIMWYKVYPRRDDV